MAEKEWEEIRAALKKPVSPEAMKEAALAFRRYRIVKLREGKGSRPILVSLGLRRGYPNAVSLDRISDELARNPNFFNLMKRVVEK